RGGCWLGVEGRPDAPLRRAGGGADEGVHRAPRGLCPAPGGTPRLRAGRHSRSAGPDRLARTLARLLDGPALRERMGREGRRRFEEHYAWDVIVTKHYRPLLRRRD